MSAEALLVPGAGTEGTQTSSLLLVRRHLGKANYASDSFVDGVTHEFGQPRATLPSEQADQIKQAVRPGVVIVTQSMGALGAIRAMRDPKVSASIAGAVFIAPPARRPYSDVLLHPVILERSGEELPADGVLRGDAVIKTFSHPNGVLFPQAYRDEVAEHDDDFDDELRALSANGIVKIVRPTRDWNDSYDVNTYPGTTEVDATHSLAGGGARELFIACRSVLKVVNGLVATTAAAEVEDQLPIIA